jgi:hypothetical protein
MKRWIVRSVACASLFFLGYAGWAFSPLTQSQQQQQGSQQSQPDAKQKKGQTSGKDNPPPAGSTPGASANGSGAEKPAPLFGGSLNIKTSRQTKDTATLGFNGVDDNGQVQKTFLAATATGDDTLKVQKLASYAVSAAELDEFIEQGRLNPAAAAKKPN